MVRCGMSGKSQLHSSCISDTMWFILIPLVSCCPIRLICSWYFCEVTSDIGLYLWKVLYITGHIWSNMCFLFAFIVTFVLVHYLVHSTPSVHDRELVLKSKSCCIIYTIKPRIWYQAMLYPDLPWVTIDIIIYSIKVSNGDDLIPFPRGEVVFRW